MTQLPAYFLPQPPVNEDEATLVLFDQLYEETRAQGEGAAIHYSLAAPKWQFLCYLCNRHHFVLHGSGRADITEFEPRKANDVTEFGDRCAVYASSDGIWAMYFAIVNRDNSVTSLINACFQVVERTGKSESYYFFSINEDAFAHTPWREGTIYLLPGDSFTQQPRQHYQGNEIEIAQWASPIPVKPLAKLRVTPEDFPFLPQILSHDPLTLSERAIADPDAFPWLEK